MTEQPAPQIRRFYDGGPFDGQPEPTAAPIIVLERTEDLGPDDFRMLRRIAYLDRQFGELLVPADATTFSTDMTSVPSVFAWLVPRSGKYLPAALIHDGLIGSTRAEPTYISTEGIEIDSEEANRVFRDAMADTGTGLVRRWLMWTAVTVATMVSGDRRWSTAEVWRWRLTAIGTLAVLVLLGLWATADLLDIGRPFIGGVPWMGEGAWWARVTTGAAGAVTIPLMLAQLWGRFRIAGMVAGTALALLLHVTIAVAALTALYRGVEYLCAKSPRVALVAAIVVGLAAIVVFVGALA